MARSEGTRMRVRVPDSIRRIYRRTYSRGYSPGHSNARLKPYTLYTPLCIPYPVTLCLPLSRTLSCYSTARSNPVRPGSPKNRHGQESLVEITGPQCSDGKHVGPARIPPEVILLGFIRQVSPRWSALRSRCLAGRSRIREVTEETGIGRSVRRAITRALCHPIRPGLSFSRATSTQARHRG
jgi:hypothetical protein